MLVKLITSYNKYFKRGYMPKIKTLRSAKKRFKKTALGKYKYKHACARHILTKKTTKHKRYLRNKSILPILYTQKLTKCIPYI